MYNDNLKTVGVFPGIFSPDECRRIIELPLPAVEAPVQSRDDSAGHVDYQVRRTREKPVPPDPPYMWIYQRLAAVAGKANDDVYNFRLENFMTVIVLEYAPDGFFGWHMDIGSGAFAARKLSMVTFLTPPEDYEGGGLCFMDDEPPMRGAQGSTLIFPSYMMHKVEPVTSGTRHTLVSWVHGPSFT